PAPPLIRAQQIVALPRATRGMALRSLHNSWMTVQAIVDTSVIVSEERQRNYGIEGRQRPLLRMPHGHDLPRAAASARGRCTVNVAPCPGTLSIVRRPPWRLRMCLTNARP